MPAENTYTLQQSITWASYYTGNRPLTLQSSNEPALTAANIIIQAIFAPPFKWRWNRNSAFFQTLNTALIWQPGLIIAQGNRLLDSNNNMQTCTVSGTTGGSTPPWNPNIGGTTVDGGVTWQTSLVSDYLQSVADFGFIEKAVLKDANGKFWEIPNKTQELTSDFGIGRFQTIAPYLDDNQGNITFRFMPGRPDSLYTCYVTYQKRAALLTALTGAGGTWPIPDMFSNIYNIGFLGMIWLFADDPRSAFMLQRFAADVIAINDGLTEQEKNDFLNQWNLMGASQRAGAKANQGLSARTVGT